MSKKLLWSFPYFPGFTTFLALFLLAGKIAPVKIPLNVKDQIQALSKQVKDRLAPR